MYSEPVCKIARSWVDVGSASFRNILGTTLYVVGICCLKMTKSCFESVTDEVTFVANVLRDCSVHVGSVSI
jgi:hypothetical protein